MFSRPALLLAAVMLVGCDADSESGPERSRDSVFSYAKPMSAGQTLLLRNMSGSLSVEPSADNTLRVVANMTWRGDSTLPTDVTFKADTTADGVLVCAVFGKGRCEENGYNGESNGSGMSIGRGRTRLGLGGRSQAQVHFKVLVPAGVKLDMVLVDGDVVSASSAPVRVRGVNGDLRVVTSVGPVRAETVNGDVDARMTTIVGTDSVKVATLNGNAFAFLPANVNATVDVATTTGTLISDFPGTTSSGAMRNSINAVLGTGTTPVRVRSMNGDAQLRRLDAQGRAFDLAPQP
jgi:hypothetical protein